MGSARQSSAGNAGGSSGSEWIAPLLVAFVALALRLGRLFELRDEILWDHLIGDAKTHQLLANEIVTGGFWGHDAFFRAPLYPYFLAACQFLSGPDLIVPRLLQILLGTASCVLVTLLGRNLFSKSVGLAAGLVTASSWVLVQYDVEIEMPSLLLFLNLAGLWVLLTQKPVTAIRGGLAGLLFGLSAITRPDVLMPVLLIAGWWLFWGEKRSRKAILVLVAGLFLPVSAVTLRNAIVANDFVFIASQGGVNFFIGNNENSDGRTPLLPVRATRSEVRAYAQRMRGSTAWTHDNIWAGGVVEAERVAGRTLKPSEISAYWFGRGFDFVLGRPADAAGLFARKIYFLLNRWEAPSSSAVDLPGLAREGSPLLRILQIVNWGVLLPLAGVGMLTSRRRAGMAPLLLYAGGYTLAIALFFVSSRFRIPLIPILAIFAAEGVRSLIAAFRDRQHRSLVIHGVFLVVLGTVANSRWADVDAMAAAVPIHNQIGDLYREEGNLDRALAEYHVSLRYLPDYAETHNNIGIAYLKAGQAAEATEHCRRAVELDPEFGLAYGCLAWALEEQGDLENARAGYGKGLELDPSLAWIRTRFAVLLSRQGASLEAAEQYRRILEDDPESVDALMQATQAYLAADRIPDALRYLRRATVLSRDPKLQHNLGILLVRSDSLAAAQVAFETAVELDSTQVSSHLRLASIFELTGNEGRVLEQYRRALRIDPGRIEVLLARASFYLRSGDRAAARQDLESIVSQSPDHAEARTLLESL